MITAAQLRAARALLGMDQRHLAEAAGLSLPTIQRMEASDGLIRGNVDSLVKLIEALEKAGVELDRRGRGQRRRGARCAAEEPCGLGGHIMTMDASLSLAALAVMLALASGAASVFAAWVPRVLRTLAMPLFGLAGLAALAAGLSALFHGGVGTATLPLGLPWLPWRVRLDALSGFFLAVIGVVSFAVGLYGPAYVRGFEHGRDSLAALGGFAGLFLTGMQLVVLADDAFAFMVSWELMSLVELFSRRLSAPARREPSRGIPVSADGASRRPGYPARLRRARRLRRRLHLQRDARRRLRPKAGRRWLSCSR